MLLRIIKYKIIFNIILLKLITIDGYCEAKDNSNQDSINFTKILSHNLIYAEIFGNTLTTPSLNYERLLYRSDKFLSELFLVYLRVGVGILLFPSHIAFPIMLNFLLYNEYSFEFGIGGYYDYSEPEWRCKSCLYTSEKIKFTITIGYRYQPLDGGFTFRVGFTPIIFPNFKILSMVGVSFGHAW